MTNFSTSARRPGNVIRKEWSLIANSILIQLAAGLYVFLAVERQIFIARGASEKALALAASGMMLTGPLILAGMILSLFHLGRPVRAARAVAHLTTSWLSREVFFTGAFLALWILSSWTGSGGAAQTALVWLTAAAGILAVLSIAGIYASTGKPGWSGINTALNFFGTLIIFGSVSAVIVMTPVTQPGSGMAAASLALILLVLLMLILRLIYQVRLISSLASGSRPWTPDDLVAAAPLPLPGRISFLHRSLTLAGWVVSFCGAWLAFCLLMAGKPDTLNLIQGAAGALVLAGETVQRMGFNSLGLSDGTYEYYTKTK